MPSLLAIPQAWVETYRPLPTGWWSNHAEGIERVWRVRARQWTAWRARWAWIRVYSSREWS